MLPVSLKFFFIATIIAGTLWAITYFISPYIGTPFTILLAVGVSVFLISNSTSKEMPPFGSYFVTGAVFGIVSVIVAISITFLLCQVSLFANNNMCIKSSGLKTFSTVIIALYLFLIGMIYPFIK